MKERLSFRSRNRKSKSYTWTHNPEANSRQNSLFITIFQVSCTRDIVHVVYRRSDISKNDKLDCKLYNRINIETVEFSRESIYTRFARTEGKKVQVMERE